MNDELLTVQEVTKRLKVDNETVYRWIRNQSLKAVKVGKLWRIRLSDIEKLLEQ